jgi:hypothetical protein
VAESRARAALEAALKRGGLSLDDLPRNTREGRAIRKYGVYASQEFKRIDALPRREWHAYENLQDIITTVSDHLRAPGGTQTLFPVQAVALLECADHSGLIAGIRTGGGKTIPSFLASVMLDAKRPVLFVPAKLRTKTENDLQAAREHWRVPNDLQVMSYEDLSQVSWCDWLMNYQPGAVIGDEAHKLKSDDSARALRMERFLEAFPKTPVVLFSGTFLRKNPRDAAKLFGWALGERSPFPLVWKDVEDWCSALDPRARKPMAPGALLNWLEPGETETPGAVRLAVGRRVAQTPGVVMSHGKGVDCGLQVVADVIEHEACEPHMKRLKTLDEAPDGWVINDAPVKWGVEQTLALGFYYVPDPRPPDEWATARREWNALARELIKDKRTTIDSDLQAWNACAAADPQPEIFTTWRDIRDTFEMNVSPVWFSDEIVQKAAAWLKKHEGVVWTQYTAFGERLAELAGVSYFSADACDAHGLSLVHAPAGPCVASIEACGEGLNLQDRWHRCLYVMPPSNGALWEQSLARFHRLGQPKTEVIADVWITSRVAWNNLQNAIAAEKAISQLSLDDQRKLAIADVLLPAEHEVLGRPGYRWVR